MLLHGYTGSARSMSHTARAFARDYEVLSPDLPGHGRTPIPSSPSGYGFDDCIDDLVATLAASGHARAHWIGYSMGARLALGCAARHPDRVASLVLVAGRAGIADAAEREARRRADEVLARRIETGGVQSFVDEWMARPIFASQRRLGADFLADARRERLAHSAQGLSASLRALGPGAQPPLFANLPHIVAPVLLVAGALDEGFVESARDLAARLPHAELCVIADAGHAVHLEQPEAFVRAAGEFLRRASSPAHNASTIPTEETAA
jgi:2-succinyl-6-hydroxy-2,4-cyclohexadiene-1-carboxylate synthase